MNGKEKNPETDNDPRKAQPVETGDLDLALKRIREQYDGDLDAFFRDAKEHVLKQRDKAAGHAEFCIL